MTYRERRQRKAERLQEWAEKRDAKAQAIHDHNESLPYAHDWAFITQPGRIPQRDAMNRRQERAWEHTKMADKLSSRASGILDQLDRSIYSDDDDAIEKLQERIATLEAERDHMKTINVTVQRIEKRLGKSSKEFTANEVAEIGLSEHDVKQLAVHVRFGDGRWRYPTYAFSNLSGNINRQKKRLAALQAERVA